MKSTIVCRCEEVTLEQLEQTAKQFNCSPRELKLRTRAGMGFCGGRTCRPAVDKVLLNVTDLRPSDHVPLKVQPPVRPISLSSLGGAIDDK